MGVAKVSYIEKLRNKLRHDTKNHIANIVTHMA